VHAVDNQKADNQGEGGIDGGTSMTPVTGDGNREGEAMERGYFQRGRGGGVDSAPRCRSLTTQQSRAMTLEAEGSGWCLDIEDDQRKLGRWTECAVGLSC
jgi:hypothetical protein